MCRYLLSVSILLISALTGTAKIVRSWVDGGELCDSCIAVDVPAGAVGCTVEVNGAMKGLKDCVGRNTQAWTLRFVTTEGTSYDFTVGWGNDNHGDVDDSRYLCVDGVADYPMKLYKGVSVYGGDNTVVVDVNSGHAANVYIGDDRLAYLGSRQFDADIDRVELEVNGTMDLDMMCVESDVVSQSYSTLTPDEIRAKTSRIYGPVGTWKYLDRDNDVDYARPGGTYTLAIVPADSNDDYLIVYMDGARVNKSQWKEGMIKGRLTTTQFTGRYDLKWYDATMEEVIDESTAQLDGDIMTFYFPLHHTQIRFSR